MGNDKLNIDLDITIIKDNVMGGYVGFVNGLQSAIEQGNTVEEVKSKLPNTIQAILAYNCQEDEN